MRKAAEKKKISALLGRFEGLKEDNGKSSSDSQDMPDNELSDLIKEQTSDSSVQKIDETATSILDELNDFNVAAVLSHIDA